MVKVGSALVTNDGRGLDLSRIEQFAAQIARLIKDGREVVFVSSGAIAEGVLRLGWEKRPKKISSRTKAGRCGTPAAQASSARRTC